MKVLKGTPKHLSAAGQLDSFTYLMLNLPFECNYRCQKCFNLKENIPKNTESPMKLNEKLELINEGEKLGAKAIVFGGEGEPTLNENIRDLVLKTNSLGMIPMIYSNGSTLSPEVVRFYKNTNSSLIISFDSLSETKYNTLTGTKKQFERVLKNINWLITEFGEPIIKNGLKVYSVAINTTVSEINVNEVKQIKKYFGDKVYFIANPLANLGNAKTYWEKINYSKNDHLNLVRRVSESGGPLTLGTDNLCGYSAYGIAISPSGDFMTCAYTDQTNSLLGNIRDISLRCAFTNKHKLEMDHYNRYGKSPCLVRSNNFNKYLEELKIKKTSQQSI